MAVFDSGYHNSMDHDYVTNSENTESVQAPDRRRSPLGVKDIGKTVIDGPNAGRFTQSIQAAIREGVSRLELTPMPNQQGHGGEVEAYGKEEREEIKQLAKINEVELTSIHVPWQTASNFSGYNPQGGGENAFSEHQRYRVIDEVKKHMRFAADAIDGGSVCIHTGEFPRSISMSEEVKKEGLFAGYPGEELEAMHTLINPKTGQVVNIKEDQEVWVPKQKMEKGDKMWLKDENGKPIVDEFFESYYGDRFDEEYNKNPERFWVPVWDYDNAGNIQTERLSFGTFRELKENQNKTEKEMLRAFFEKQQSEQIHSALGQAREFETHYNKGLEERHRIVDALNFYRKLKGSNPDQDWSEMRQVLGSKHPFVPPEIKDPIEYLEKALDDNNRMIAYGRETSVSGRTRARMFQDLIEYSTPIEDYALAKSTNSLAELGVDAWRLTKEKHTAKPITLTPENMIPEMGYGAHPKELLKIVTGGRKAMVERLTKKRIPHPSLKLDENNRPIMMDNPDYNPSMSVDQAKELAKTHIKATLDTAHMGMWYKHFQPKQGESEAHREQRFKKWYKDSIKDLADKDIIGNVHMVDTFGSADSHLAAGKGMLGDTLLEAVEYLKEKGVASISSEGFSDPREQITGVWEAFGSPIYSIARSAAPCPVFGDVRNSYFGRANPPPYVLHPYSPSEDWTLWSGVGLE